MNLKLDDSTVMNLEMIMTAAGYTDHAVCVKTMIAQVMDKLTRAEEKKAEQVEAEREAKAKALSKVFI